MKLFFLIYTKITSHNIYETENLSSFFYLIVNYKGPVFMSIVTLVALVLAGLCSFEGLHAYNIAGECILLSCFSLFR